MSRPAKLTKSILKKIIKEEREKIKNQKKKIQEVKLSKDIKKFYNLRKELKTLLQLKREQRILFERIKNIQIRKKNITKKIKE
jgi:hypothetical protein